MSKIGFQDGDCDGHLGFSIHSFGYFVSHKHPNAHHQVSIQLDYRYVQNMNSQHFSHVMYRAHTKACMGMAAILVTMDCNHFSNLSFPQSKEAQSKEAPHEI